MKGGLFRQQAVMARSVSRFGSAMFYQPPTLRIFCLGTVTVFVLLLMYSFFAEINDTVRVRGFLAPEHGEVKLYPGRSGVVSQLNVKNGSMVEVGDVLAVFSEISSGHDGSSTAKIMAGFLDQQISLLEHRIELANDRALIAGAQLADRSKALKAELLLVQAEFHLLSQRLVFGEQDYNANNVLFERGVISERERNQTAANWYSLQQLGNNAEQNITARSMMLEDAHRQYELQKMTAKEELLALKLTLAQLQSQHHELLSRGDYTLTATRAGRVYNLIHAPGEFIDARTPLVTLLPVDYQLEARIYLPSRAIGKIQPEQTIILSFDAFPTEKYGRFQATVQSISETAMDPREYMFPVDLREPVYLVRALPEKLGEHFSESGIRAGLQFSADIVTSRQSLLQRLLTPMLNLGNSI
jgi:membrane fusion protein